MAKSAHNKRIGILGGSFNPIHQGHLLMAERVRQSMNLDQVIFMPANHSPHKIGFKLADAKHRLNMIKLAIKGNPSFSVCDWELKQPGPSYTAQTLDFIRTQYPQERLFWIIGYDLVPKLKTWQRFEDIIRMASFIVANRGWFNISSSEIRALLKQKKSIRYLTPDSVIRYIRDHKLYT